MRKERNTSFNSLSKFKGGIIMTNYINIDDNTKNISGMDIETAMIGKFIRIIRNNKKELVPCNQIKISRHAIYKIEDCGNSIKITKGNGWTCTKEEYENIQTEGKKVFDEIFGDIFKKIDDAGIKRR